MPVLFTWVRASQGEKAKMPSLMAIPEAAAYLSISNQTLRSLVRQRKIRHCRPTGAEQGRIKFKVEWLDEWRDQTTVAPEPEEAEEADELYWEARLGKRTVFYK
jgi:excisionase family DNA binding protein